MQKSITRIKNRDLKECIYQFIQPKIYLQQIELRHDSLERHDLLRLLKKVYMGKIVFVGFVKLLIIILQYVQPFLLDQLTDYIEDYQ